jgi:bidirectional [NiFe] hydrogenase diaphorase subunit
MVAAPPKNNQLNTALSITNDKRWRLVVAVMRRHGYSADALIETLHTLQNAFGYLEKASLQLVAAELKVPLSMVYGVATFYNLFTLKPQGEHTCVVCLGTACYIKGAPEILTKITDTLGIRPGETTPNGHVSLLTARCLGACGLAPAAIFDGEVAGKLLPDDAIAKLEALSDKPASDKPEATPA